MVEAAKGISPKTWGPVTWAMLHGLAHVVVKAPSAHRVRALRLLFLAMPRLLPCRMCRQNMHRELKQRAVPRDDDAWALARWVHDLHNAVNRTTGKARVPPARGLDALLVAMDAGRALQFAETAFRGASGYIVRCLAERRALGERYERHARQYKSALRAFGVFARAGAFLLSGEKGERLPRQRNACPGSSGPSARSSRPR
jgi:hypothetical protein